MVGDLFAAPAAGVVRVALPLALDGLFDYAVPAGLEGAARPGHRVRVPFESRRLVGVVVECASEPTPEARGRLRPLEAVLDDDPVLSTTMIAMLREEADRVLCPLGLALAAALPPGSGPRTVETLVLTPRGASALEARALPPASLALLGELSRAPRPPAALRRQLPDAGELLPPLEADGLVARRKSLAGARVRPRTEKMAARSQGLDAEAALTALARAPRQQSVLRALADGPLPTAELERRVPGASRATVELARRGYVEISRRLAPLEVASGFQEPPVVELTAEQAEALGTIEEAVAERRPERFLLHGVTGSGKTEVYLRAVARALREGRQALVLVPEITLTHQIVARLRARFGDQVSVLHSGLRPGERLAQWELLRTGARAARPVGAAAHGRHPDRRRRALRPVRAARGPGRDRRRRGARGGLQERGGVPLSRPLAGGAPGKGRALSARDGLGHALPRDASRRGPGRAATPGPLAPHRGTGPSGGRARRPRA
jgi:primosomal protein N' (replication factor Y)